ncbi:MAG: type IV-A pilus assembly ATPase PilB [Gammaproteobacteria bacterium]|nr:type IV-A pilus assembly ATPase PilB [Gammaproteobacteria bacterium]
MATPNSALNLSGLALRLVRNGFLEQEMAERLQKKSLEKNLSFFAQLTKSKKIPSSDLARTAAEEFGVPLLDVSAMDLEQIPIGLVDEKIIQRHQALPIYKRGTKLFIAIADPTNTGALDEIKFHTGLGTEPILVDATAIEAAIHDALDAADTSLADLAGEGLDDIDITSVDEEDEDKGREDERLIDTPIVRFVNKLLLDAINRDASDIHIEPYEGKFRVRYRVDGVLHEIASPPPTLSGRIAARVKILSKLDIAERRVPQDGRMKMRLSKNRAIDFRVSTLPTLHGEKVVVRVLDSSGGTIGIDKLGLDEKQQQLYTHAIGRPYGMVLVTGPTGSGKTVTLYNALNNLNSPDRNISTVEDPVEINLTGVNQVNINEKSGLTFSTALRAFLRQDPDIIMVGEIRDLETADIAIKASQTGHMVLSTLHTNDAPSTLTRMLNMGVAPFNIASAVHLILAQRLVRVLCLSCKKPASIPEEALLKAGFEEKEFASLKIHSPVGCNNCTNGYKGRIGVFQVMPISEAMGNLIMEGCTQVDIEVMARKEGIMDLRRAGLNKVATGITSLEEVERVTNI